ncbi:MAG: glycoside hydrolase family 32 protein [Bacteroidaceae bacterium]|nr:glycoside hydrolase family 32 protein [Bacteroidaceae bacterium]
MKQILVDRHSRRFFVSAVICLLAGTTSVVASERVMKIQHDYLRLPVSQSVPRSNLTLSASGVPSRSFEIRLAENPEYWVWADVRCFRGKKLTITSDKSEAALALITQSDSVGDSGMFKEENRPLIHFTARCGWINDPNGLVYYDGEYHLFFQHNPYEREWGNMHWGHAVSPDLMHWEEIGEALFPDALGTMFSGSVVVDSANTSGFGKPGNPAMVAFYTADNADREVQCVAWSFDHGRTWTKYEKNPVIDSKEKWGSRETRDPKVFWYAPVKHWVMVLCEKDGNSIYTSNNLREWIFRSHIPGFWECPELFELCVDGNPEKALWVMMGASGNYMLGAFDGYKFVPLSGKLAYCFGAIYAAQTYNGIPASDGRRILIGWDRVDYPGMPFKGQMSVPMELSLKTTANGIRLFAQPVKELSLLQGEKVIEGQDISFDEAARLLAPYAESAALRMKMTFNYTHCTSFGMDLGGQRIIDCDLNSNLMLGHFYSLREFDTHKLVAEVLLDKTSVEIFLDEGGVSYCLERRPAENNASGFRFWGNHPVRLSSLEVYTMKSYR